MPVYLKKSINNLIRLGAMTLCFSQLVPQVLAEEWTYVQEIDKSFFTAYDGSQSQALVNAAIAIPVIQRPGESLKVPVRVPAGVSAINVSTQGVFGGITGGRPLIARFDYDPATICISNPNNCSANSAPLLTPPFHTANSSLSETIYNSDILSVEEANLNGGKTVAVTIYHGAAAPSDFALGKLSISLAVSDTAAYNAWINNTAVNPTHSLSIATEGAGSVSSSPSNINCGVGLPSCTAKFNEGSAVTLTATPDDGFTFSNWGGDCSGTTTTTTVAMTSAKGCTAIFANDAVLKLNIGINGSGSVSSSGINCGSGGSSCETTALKDQAFTLTAQAAEDSVFDNWSGDCSGTDPVVAIALSTNKQCTANFSAKQVVVTPPPAAGGNNMDRPAFILPAGTLAGSTKMQLAGRIDEYEALPYLLTNADDGAQFPLEDSILSLNLNITPDSTLVNSSAMDILLLANWVDDAGNAIWLQKIKPQGSFDFNDNKVWERFELGDAMANGFTTYRSNLPVDTGFSTSIGSGKVVAPMGLGTKGRTLTFYPAYQQQAAGSNSMSFIVTLFSFVLPDSFLASEYNVAANANISISTDVSNDPEYIANDSCVIADSNVATATFNQSIGSANNVLNTCNVTGVSAGQTYLTVTTNTGKEVTTSIVVN